MATAYLLSHGARVETEADTFVPEGRSISFYSEFDENTLRTIGLAAVNAGDITPTETFNGGDAVSNYVLVRFADDEMAEHLAAASSQTDGALYFTGAELPEQSWLCTTPTQCAATYPNHADACRGIFNLIPEEDILSVSCRGAIGGPGKSTFEMEGSTEFMDDLGAETVRILEWAKTDPDAAMEYYQSLSEATRVMLNGANTNLAKWAQGYYSGGGTDTPAAVVEARNFVESHGDIAFVDYAEQFDAQQRSIVLAENDLLEAYWLGYGRRLLRAEGAPAFWEFFRGVDPQWTDLLSNDPELYDAIAAGSQGADVAEEASWEPTADDFAEATSNNEPFVKDLDEDVEATWEIGGAVVLLGEPSSELASRVRQRPDYASGTFQVERARFGAGSLRFSGVPPVFQDTVTWAVGQFSKKDVKFD